MPLIGIRKGESSWHPRRAPLVVMPTLHVMMKGLVDDVKGEGSCVKK